MDEYGVDLDEIGRVIDVAEVLVVRFQVVEARLLLDFRTSSSDGPLIKIVPRAGSVEERFRSLKKLRPAFPLPDRILSFLWPRGVMALEESGVLSRLERRLGELGGVAAQTACAEVYGELRREESAMLVAAIRGGDGFQTLWQRDPEVD